MLPAHIGGTCTGTVSREYVPKVSRDYTCGTLIKKSRVELGDFFYDTVKEGKLRYSIFDIMALHLSI